MEAAGTPILRPDSLLTPCVPTFIKAAPSNTIAHKTDVFQSPQLLSIECLCCVYNALCCVYKSRILWTALFFCRQTCKLVFRPANNG